MVIETSRPIARVPKELGINEGTLGSWVSRYGHEHAGEEPPLAVSERVRLRRELERETRELRMENEFLKKPPGVLCQGSSVSDKFEFIDAECAAYRESGQRYVPSIVKMCLWMEVSRSGFYEWRGAPESATARRRGVLAVYVEKSFGDSDGSYGYRRGRVHAAAAEGSFQTAHPIGWTVRKPRGTPQVE